MLDIVNNFVNVNTCTVGGMQVSDIGASNATKFISGTHEAVVTNGVLYNFEQRTGYNIRVEKLTVKASIKRGALINFKDQKISVNVSTNAAEAEVYFDKDFSYVQSFNTGEFGGSTQYIDENRL
jgi:dihydrodipicolinate synthase/N-acetylneuraminate lyase